VPKWDAPAVSPNTLGYSVPNEFRLFPLVPLEAYEDQIDLVMGEILTLRIGLGQVRVDGNRHAQSAQHIRDSLGSPKILTVDKDDKAPDRRRVRNTQRHKSEFGPQPPGYAIDESPPALFEESVGASVRSISFRDNSGAGASIGNQLGGFRDGWQVDFFATPPPSNARNLIGNLVLGSSDDDVLRGLRSNDTLRGNDGQDQILGGPGDDRIFGNDQGDFLIGDIGTDVIVGGAGNDTLFGGAGTDDLFGGLNRDIFIIQSQTGLDTIKDFEVGTDLIGISVRSPLLNKGFGSPSRNLTFVRDHNDTIIQGPSGSLNLIDLARIEDVLPFELSGSSSFRIYGERDIPFIGR
jgi:hypothetical protein